MCPVARHGRPSFPLCLLPAPAFRPCTAPRLGRRRLRRSGLKDAFPPVRLRSNVGSASRRGELGARAGVSMGTRGGYCADSSGPGGSGPRQNRTERRASGLAARAPAGRASARDTRGMRVPNGGHPKVVPILVCHGATDHRLFPRRRPLPPPLNSETDGSAGTCRAPHPFAAAFVQSPSLEP